MDAEYFIKSQTDKMLNKFNEQFMERGLKMSPQAEYAFRAGASFGLSLSSMLLSSFPEDVTMNDNLEDNQ